MIFGRRIDLGVELDDCDLVVRCHAQGILSIDQSQSRPWKE